MAEERLTSLDTIRELRSRQPFIPFTVVLTSGDRYVIESSEALAIGSTQLHYYLPRSDRAIHMALFEIAAIEETQERISK
ncbi:MAG TPA: hypothetical protein VFE47_00315 [Tepidisphaeraceae bacterium]|jgi:hypothetical protein|nr:hypothetical protein [Tepidisphaeraceae bacterium]